MDSEDQEKRAKRNCGKLYRKLLRGCNLVLDDEKYFTFTGHNMSGNRLFYSTDPSTAPTEIKFRKKKKFEAKMGISSKGVSDVYVHKSKQGIRQGIFLNECINKRLLPFIDKYHSNRNDLFWADLASAHYSKTVQERLNEKNVPFVIRKDNPLNVPQARPIETIWTLLERKVYENNCEAKNLDLLARRIKQKSKELDLKMLRSMIESVKGKCAEKDCIQFYEKVYCSIFRVLSNEIKTRYLARKIVEL